MQPSMNRIGGIRNNSWVWVLILFTFASFIEAIFWGQMIAFTPLYLEQLGIPPANVAQWTGIITAISSALGLPFLPFWGALADRYARQPIIVRSFVAYLIAGIIAMLAGNVWIFMLGRAVISLSLGNSGLMMTTLSERAPSFRQGLAFSVMNTAAPVGIFIGPLVGGPIVDHWGFPTLLAIDTVLMLSIVLLLTFGYRDSFHGHKRGSILKMAADSVHIILQSPRLRSLFPALFLLYAGWQMAMTYVPLVVTTQYSGSDKGTVIGIILGVGGFSALLISPILGLLADRYGLWRVLFIGAGLEVILWLVPLLVVGLAGFAIAWALINGVASGVFAISFSVLAKSTTSNIRGRVMAFAYLPVNIGSIFGPLVGSIITRNSLYPIFPAAAVLTLTGMGMLVLALRQAVSTVSQTLET